MRQGQPWDMMIGRVPSPALPDLRSALRLAGPAWPLVSVQERGTAGAAARDRRVGFHNPVMGVDLRRRGQPVAIMPPAGLVDEPCAARILDWQVDLPLLAAAWRYDGRLTGCL